MVKAMASVRAFPSNSDLLTQFPLVSVVTGVSVDGVQEMAINTILSGNKKKYLKRFMNEILAQIIRTGVCYFVKMDFRLHLQDESSYFVCKCFNSFLFSHYFNRLYLSYFG